MWLSSPEVPCDFPPAIRLGLWCSLFHLLWLQVIWRHRRHRTICSVKPQQCFPPELFMLWQLRRAIFNICWAETKLCSKLFLSIASKGKNWKLIWLVIIFKNAGVNRITKNSWLILKEGKADSLHVRGFTWFLSSRWFPDKLRLYKMIIPPMPRPFIIEMVFSKWHCSMPCLSVYFLLWFLNNPMQVTLIEYLLYSPEVHLKLW